MPFYADPQEDLPQPWKRKRIVFYAVGMKIYGQIPYILQRRLGAEFYSNNAPFLGGRLIAPTLERNYTVVPYHRDDGTRHNDEILESLMGWLIEGEGFEWAIAGPRDFNKEIRRWNAWESPPDTWIPGEKCNDAISAAMLGEIRPLLALQDDKKR